MITETISNKPNMVDSQQKKERLHLGCGHVIKEGWLNHDLVALPGVDVAHDLRIFPWPFENGQFVEVFADNVIEHLPDTVRTMEEIYRITRPGGSVFIGVPYWNSLEAWGDPTHKKVFTEEMFDFFDPTTWMGKQREYYTVARFKIEKITYCINPFKPLSRSPRTYRFDTKVNNKMAKGILRILSTYFCNIIHALDVYLTRL